MAIRRRRPEQLDRVLLAQSLRLIDTDSFERDSPMGGAGQRIVQTPSDLMQVL